jgi:hypothetical protein
MAPNDRFPGSRPVRTRRGTSVVGSLLLGAVLVGCGGGGAGSDTPAVCGSVDSLKSSVDKVKDTDITSSGAVSDLQTGLAGIRSDLTDVKTDAKSEFASQIDTAEKSYGTLKTSVEAAKADVSAATLAAAGSALSAFGTDVTELAQDIESTC